MMNETKTASFRFHGALNDFLRSSQREQAIPLSFREHQTVKHLIEALGVPHVELGPVNVNGAEVGLEYQVQDGDAIEVYPIACGCPLEPRFLLDNHLGRLAAHLRMLGFDTLYRNDYEDAQLAAILEQDRRILLTRDRRLLMRKVVQYGYCLRSLEPLEQLREVIRRFDLLPRIRPFRRCLRCNAPLEPVSKQEVWPRLLPLTRKYYDEFRLCRSCNQIYWKGSHYERMQALIASLQTELQESERG